MQPWTTALRQASWRLLVERHHYEFTPDPSLASGVVVGLGLEPLDGREYPRLLQLHRQVMRDTLDAHDSSLIKRVGLEEATRESLQYLLDAGPWECIRLGYADNRTLVGYVSWRAMEGGRGFLLFVGVDHSARGHGYGRTMLAQATRGLIDARATTHLV